MQKYCDILRVADFRRLWVGSTLSMLGDGASWTAMAWLSVTHGGATSLSLLGLCYTAPILIGGVLAGAVVDRFSRRGLLIADSLIRGFAMAYVPLSALIGHLQMWQLYAVATVCGLFKILPIAITPAVISELVSEERVTAGIALETIAQGVASLAGPALGGMLVPVIGAPQVLALDAATFLAFPLFILRMENRLSLPAADSVGRRESRSSWLPVLRLLLKDRVLLAITLAFSALNIGSGMLMVVQPWLAHERMPGGALILGVLVAVLAAAELLGSFIGGMLPATERPMLRIGLIQTLAGTGLLLFLSANLTSVVLGQLIFGAGTTLATVSSQVVRIQRTPAHLWARTMTLMRTLMLGAIPLGSLSAGPLLAANRYPETVLIMALLVSMPGVLVVWKLRFSVHQDASTPSAPPAAANPTEPTEEPSVSS